MNLGIKKIRLNELENFVNSKMFREFEFVPISLLRVKSYLKNPSATAEDTVLYLGFIENRLVAFRSIFAGSVNSANNQIRFGWCSGNWVHPDFRRKGFSEKLLNEAFNDWDKKLMFTNYAPNSENLYLKTGWFKPVHEFNGIRGYLFPKTRKLVPAANKNILFKIVFSVIDFFIFLWATFQSIFFLGKNNPEIKFTTLKFPDKVCYQLLQRKGIETVFNRGEEELRWVFKFPWISDEETETGKKYPFSAFSNSFYYKTVKVFSDGKFAGFFIFSVREGHLKTLFFCLTNGLENEVTIFLRKYCTRNRIEMVTVYKKELATELLNRKFPFLHVKKYGQKIYSTFKIKNDENLNFQDGDGDTFFT
ncbi:MAG: GNAT family N-acetyltransferase [Bacteroidota bacterium]